MAERFKHPHLDTYASVQSSSQQDLWTLCKRRWGYSYILGLREPGSPATELGTEVEDEQLTPYLLKGRPFDHSRPTNSGAIAAAAVQALSNREPNFSLQTHLVVPSAIDPTVAYQGYLDMYEPSIVPRIRDFKTSSNPEKWGKTADELGTTNRQSILYAHWALRGGLTLGPKDNPTVGPSAPHGSVRLEWLYLRTKTPYRAKPVRLQLWQGDTDQAFHDLIDVPGQAIAHAKKTCSDPKDLPRNIEACNEFNKPCPHLERCFAPKEEPKTMLDLASIASRIAASTPSGTTLVPGPSAVPPPAVSVFPPVMPVGSLVPVPSIVTVAPVAINPPEQHIDPATVPVIDLSPPARPEATTEDKPKRTRRTKAQIEADNAAEAAAKAGSFPATVGTLEQERALMNAEAGGLDKCPVPYELDDMQETLAKAIATPGPDTLFAVTRTEPDEVTATYGVEKICIGFSTCEIGPFTYKTTVQPGETPLQAFNRAQDMVKTIASSALTVKLPAFLNLLQTVPGAK